MVNTESTNSSWSLAVSSLAVRHWQRPWMLLTLGCRSWKGRCSFHCLCHRRGHWANPVKKWPHSTQPPQCPGWPEAQGTAAAMEQSRKFSTAMGRKVVESQLFNNVTLEFPSRGLEPFFFFFFVDARPGWCPCFADQMYKKWMLGLRNPLSIHLPQL